MSPTDVILSILAIATPIGGAGFGYGFKRQRVSGKESQELADLKAAFQKHVEENKVADTVLGNKIESLRADLAKIDKTSATTQTDVAWLKKFLTNGHAEE